MWRSIAARRYAAGQLWSPSMSLDMMRRDLGGFELPLYWTFSKNASPPWVQEIHVCFPLNWADDDLLGDLSVEFGATFDVTAAGGDQTYSLEFEGGENTETGTVSGSATIRRRWSTWPTTVQSFDVEAATPGTATSVQVVSADSRAYIKVV